MKYIALTDQNKSQSIINDIDWEHSFVKDVHLISPTYLEGDGVVAPDAAMFLRVCICIPENPSKWIEFTFEEVSMMNVSMKYDILPVINIKRNEVEFHLSCNECVSVKCKALKFRCLDTITNGGLESFYSYETIFESTGLLSDDFS